MRYGANGYAMYWYCIELIASRVAPDNVTFELKHDAEVIGFHLKIDTLLVEKIMIDMVEMGLFESSGERITCLKLAKRLDNTMAQNKEIKETLSNFNSLKAEEIRLEEIRLEEKRLEEKRLEENRTEKNRTEKKKTIVLFVQPSLQQVLDYKSERNSKVDAEEFVDFYESNGWKVSKNKMKCWKACFRNWEKRERKQNVQYQTANEKAAERMRHTFGIDTATEF